MDLEQSIKQYSEKNDYPISDFVEVHCDLVVINSTSTPMTIMAELILFVLSAKKK